MNLASPLQALLRPLKLQGRRIYLYKYALSTSLRMFGWRQPKFECPNCGREDTFLATGQPPRYGAECPNCGSAERHRLLALVARKEQLFKNRSVLHFAPEKSIARLISEGATRYATADLQPGRAEMVLDIEHIDQPDASWDVVVASHILEHVDDAQALSELRRVLRPGGILIVMTPIVEGWDTSYENPSIVDPVQRAQHFGQTDHVRYYGRDLRARLRNAGFGVVEHTALAGDCIRHGLMRGEKVFICTKS
jgi:SAM-dependent methyltransferase